MDKQLQSGVYKHHSGLMVLVLGVARHSESEEKLVAYVPLGVKEGPRITVRPYELFFEEVSINGQKIPRFEFVGTEMDENLANEYSPLSMPD